jgi:phage shock protein C
MIAGVAGGLAQYVNLDPTLVRLAFVLLGLTSGIGLLAYIILAVVVPERPADESEPVITSSLDSDRGRELMGYALVGFGLLLLASNLGLFRVFDWGRYWPILLILGGVALLVNHARQ